MQNVVNAGKLPCALKRHNVSRLGDNAYNTAVTAGVSAYVADLLVGKSLAYAAEMYLPSRINKRLGKFLRCLGGLLKYAESKPLRGFLANARQTLEL